MTDYIFSIILLIIALIAIELRKIYHALPKNEIRYRARHGDKLASKIYHAVAYQESLEILLWIVIILSVSGSLILLNYVAPTWLNFVAVAVYLGLAFAWLPRVRHGSISEKLALYLTPAIVWLLNYLHPTFQKAYNIVTRKKSKHAHTGIYDHEGLYTLLEKQKSQEDSRISLTDLELVTKTLDLSKKTVGEYQKSWPKVLSVKQDDSIGPILLDELHKSDQNFAAVKGDRKELVGILDISRLDIASDGRVKEHMDSNIQYLGEEESLQRALKVMTRSSHLVFVVKDKKDANVGLITLSDVLNELLVEEPEHIEEDIVDEEILEPEQINDTDEPLDSEDNQPEAVRE